MFVACVSVAFVASNSVIKEIAGLISRGALISCMLVLCVLPSMLASSERFDIFVKASGGIKGLTERFLKELNEQAKKSAEKLKEGAEKIKVGAEKLIENAKQLQGQVLKGGDKRKNAAKTKEQNDTAGTDYRTELDVSLEENAHEQGKGREKPQANERSSNANKRSSNADERSSNANERSSNANERSSNADERSSNANECTSNDAE